MMPKFFNVGDAANYQNGFVLVLKNEEINNVYYYNSYMLHSSLSYFICLHYEKYLKISGVENGTGAYQH